MPAPPEMVLGLRPLRVLVVSAAPPSSPIVRQALDDVRVITESATARELASTSALLARDPDVVLLADSTDATGVALRAWWCGVPVLRVEGATRCCSSLVERLAPDTAPPTEHPETLRARLAALARRPGVTAAAAAPVSVVIPALNEVAVIDEVLAPIVEQLLPDDEVIVVDSGSVDGTRDRVRLWSDRDARVRLLEVAPCTIAGSRNQGVKAAKHATIACTDAGCHVDPQWLAAFRSAASELGPSTLLVGVFRAQVGQRLFEAAFAAVAWPDPDELRRAALPWRWWLRTIGPQYSEARVDGRSVCFSRESFDRAGGFREDLVTAEDEAFGRDVLAAGDNSCLVPEASVAWYQRSSARLAFRQFRGYGRGAVAGGSLAQARIDALRGLGYAAMLALASCPGRRRLAAVSMFGAILAFPAARVVRRGHPAAALLLLPAAQLVKDMGKLTGVVEAVLLDRRGPLPRPEGSDQK